MGGSGDIPKGAAGPKRPAARRGCAWTITVAQEWEPMSYAATPSPLNPLRAALGQCKADRERCENEIDTLVAERERISSMLPELRRQQNAQTEKVETLDRELHIYDCAIKDLEDQFGPLLGTRVELKEAAEVRAERYADAEATCSLPLIS